MQVSNIRSDNESLWNFLNFLLAIVDNLQLERHMLHYDQTLQKRRCWDDSLSLFSIQLDDITETFGIVFMPQMFLTSVWLFFF